MSCAGQSAATQRATTSPSSLRDLATAHRTFLRHAKRLFLSRAFRLDDFQDLRNNLAALFYQHPIANAHSQTLDLVGVVQRGPRDCGAGQKHRLQIRDRRQRTGPPYLDRDVEHLRRRLSRRILVGDGPARRFLGRAKFVLQRGGVYLYHQPIDLVVKIVSLRFHSVANSITSSIERQSFRSD